MYFSISEHELSEFPYRTQLAPHLWFQSYYPIEQNQKFGYQLGEYGGNFVEFVFGDKEINVEFSFYKDFTLGMGPGIVLTNIKKYIETSYSQHLVKFYCHDEMGVNWSHYKKVKSAFNPGIKTWNEVLESVERTLQQNLVDCLAIAQPAKIAFSGGLDSSTLAFLAHHNKFDFVGVVANHTKPYLDNLPFAVDYHNTDDKIDFPYSQCDNVKPGFYTINNLVTGYYGDLALLHHGELYAQSRNLVSSHFDCYDTATYSPEHIFENVTALRSAIIKLHSQPMFHQWFGDFQILDPYRDPELFLAVNSLGTEDLVKQLATGALQKDLIAKWNPSWVDYLCQYKNEYQ